MRFPDFNDDWTQCCISDYGDIVTGSTPSTSDPENYQENGFLWASPADINESKFIEATKTTLSLKGFNSTRKLPPYTVLVVCIGSTIGKMAMSKTIMATNQQINSIVVCVKYSPEFVYYAIDSRFPQYLTSVAVQAVPIISKSTFGALESCAPSLAEQKKIADFLSLIDERINNLSETIKELKTQKAGLLNQLFSQKLRFPDFNDEWTQTTLGEILLEESERNSKNINRVISSTINGLFDQKEYFNRDIASKDISNYKILKRNQLVLSPQNIWMGNINVNLRFDVGIVSPSYKIYSLDHDSIDFRFASYALKTPIMLQRYKDSSSQGASVVRRNLDIDSFYSVTLPLPSLEEQKKIADFLSLIDERIEAEEQLLKKYEEQKKYLLRHMFV